MHALEWIDLYIEARFVFLMYIRDARAAELRV